MSAIKRNNRLIYKDYEPPSKKIVSEADIYIKKLADRQQIRHVNLQDILQKQQHFQKVSEYISYINCCSGTLPLDKFKLAIIQLESIEDLKACNLSNEDIKFIVDYKECNMIDTHKNVEPGVLQIRIERILQSLNEYKHKYLKDSLFSTNNLSNKQHEALTIKPDSIETKLYKFALQNEIKRPNKGLPTLMDGIKNIEENLFSHLQEEKAEPNKIQKQLRRYSHKINTKMICGNKIQNHENNFESSFVNHSKWDQKDKNYEKTYKILPAMSNKLYTCVNQNYYTIKNGEIVKLNQKIGLKKIEISENRLSLENIRMLPQFKNYETGIPSKVLYLKNLPKCIDESDLRKLFSEFNHMPLLFKIMKGRMKRQAFVTFPDVTMATKAQQSVNGRLLCEKPVVIEFGKHA